MSLSVNRRVVFEPPVEDPDFTRSALVVPLSDGREIRMPLDWSEGLCTATPKQQTRYPPPRSH